MNFIQLENFIAFITFAIFLNILNVKINGYSVPRNISDEIKSIFRHNYVSTQSKTAKGECAVKIFK